MDSPNTKLFIADDEKSAAVELAIRLAYGLAYPIPDVLRGNLRTVIHAMVRRDSGDLSVTEQMAISAFHAAREQKEMMDEPNPHMVPLSLWAPILRSALAARGLHNPKGDSYAGMSSIIHRVTVMGFFKKILKDVYIEVEDVSSIL